MAESAAAPAALDAVEDILISDVRGARPANQAAWYLWRGSYIYDAASKKPLSIIPGDEVENREPQLCLVEDPAAVPSCASRDFDMGNWKDVYVKQIKTVDWVGARLEELRQVKQGAIRKWGQQPEPNVTDCNVPLEIETTEPRAMTAAEISCRDYLLNWTTAKEAIRNRRPLASSEIQKTKISNDNQKLDSSKERDSREVMMDLLRCFHGRRLRALSRSCPVFETPWHPPWMNS